LQALEDLNERHYPESIKMQSGDKSIIVIEFAHETLKYGKCYKLQLSDHT
jgi:hypothetical protein